MSRVSGAVAALRREQRGLTLIELLIAATVGLVVVGGATTMFIGGVRSQPRTAASVAAIQQARVTLERITRELRQGVEVPVAEADRLAIVTYVKAASCGGPAASTSTLCRVTYACGGSSCTRAVSEPDGSAPGAATTAVRGLSGASAVFSYEPSATEPGYVGVAFSFATSDGRSPVEISDGVSLRNDLGAAA